MGQFGEAYRGEVRDVNNGKIQTEKKGLESNLNLSGSQTTYTDPSFSRPQDAFVQNLLQVGKDLSQVALKEEQETDFNEARLRGAQAGVEEISKQEPTWFQKLGFKSAGYKGFQQGAIDTAVSKQFMSKMNSMETDVKALDTEEYSSQAKKEMIEIIKDYKDPETKNRIVENLTKNIESLTQSHLPRRIAYERELRKQQQIEQISQAAVNVKSAAALGDTQLILQAAADVVEALKPVPGMDKDEWSDTTTRAIITQLRREDNSVLDVMKRNGNFDKLVGEDKDAINHESDQFDQRNSRKVIQQELELRQAVQNQSENRYDLFNRINKDNPSAISPKAFWDADARRAEEVNAQRARDAEVMQSLLSGSFIAQQATPEERQKAWVGISNEIADRIVLSDKQRQIETAQNSGEKLPFDPEAIANGSYQPSAAERSRALMTNPQAIITLWKKNQLPLPALASNISNMNALLSSENLDEQSLEVVSSQLNALAQFEKADPSLFAKAARSNGELMDFVLYNQFINEDGMVQRNAVEQIRQIKKRPIITELDETQQVWVDEDTADITEGIISDIGEKSLWVFNKDPNNRQVMEDAVQEAYTNAIITTRGNRSEAQAIVKHLMYKKSAVIGNKFIPNGQELQKEALGFSIEDYIKGRENTDEFNDDKQWWGFDGDVSLLDDPNVWITNAGGSMPLQFNRYKDGRVITYPVPLPKSKDQMLRFGVSGSLLNATDAITSAPIGLGNKIIEQVRKFNSEE